jgi:hypothetical protein
MPTSHETNHVLTQLEAAQKEFHPGQAALVAKLLRRLSTRLFTDPHALIRFHECLLFLRAFPPAASLVPRVEHLLNTFHQRVEKLRVLRADMSIFDDFDTSGISATTMQDTLSFDVAQWLVRRIPRNIDIAWDDYWADYQGERARGAIWPRFIPLLEEDAEVEANIPWTRWLDAARGRQPALAWLLTQFQHAPVPPRQQAELYDSLRLPIRWNLANLKLSRTRNWTRPRSFYFHTGPLLQRSQISLSRELSRPAPKLVKLPLAAAEPVLRHVREVMFVRYRELYGTTLGDPSNMVRADLGRGVVIHLWGLPATRRLPLRAYLCGYTLKNGVPIHYFEAIGLCEWLEIGFNVFYTYRQGETAWIYAQTLRCIRALTAATCFSIYPYQIGQENDEAIDSGAFWFYRKLGFRPGRPDLQALCEREEKRIAANPQYRTSRRTLKRLAEAHMFYDVNSSRANRPALTDLGLSTEKITNRSALKGRGFSRAESVAQSNAALAAGPGSGAWDTFSIRTVALRVNRRMAQQFNGNSKKMIEASTAAVARALRINPIRWTANENHALENWSLVLALIPDLAGWTPPDRRQLIEIIRSKSARNEMLYLRETQRHPRLRQALLLLGSK